MKKFIKGRWFPLTIAVIIVVALLIFLCCIGFRITYNPALENSWEAISAFAAWGGVVMSFIAIVIAIQVPKKIADRQDKIALFEKRMECYSTLQNIFAFARQISDEKTKKAMQTALKFFFGEPSSFPENQKFTWYMITLKRQEPIIVGGQFLFTEYNEEELQNLLMDIIELSRLVAVKTVEEAEQPISDTANNYKENICNVCSNLEKTLIPLMEKELQLQRR